MRKMCSILIIGAFLALMTAIPSAMAEDGKVKFTINMGGLLAQISQGYDFDFSFDSRDETARWSESVGNVGSAFGLDIGAGIYPIPQLEIYASYNSYGGNGMGGYTLSLPHWYYYNEPVSHTIANVENEFKASIFSFGLAFHPTVKGRIKPYFGAGVSSVSVKVDLLDSVSLNDLAEYSEWYDFYYPYYWYEADESIEITSVGFTKESETVWGFHAKVGVDVEVGKSICIFAEARYLSAKVEFDRPDITSTARTTLDYYLNYYGYVYEETLTETIEEEFEIDDTVEIKVGGIQAVIGIRFSF